MKRTLFSQNSPLPRLFEESAEAWRNQDYGRAIDALEQARRLAPGNTRVLLDLGRAYGMRYNYEEASKCFEKAVQISPTKSTILVSAANHAHDFGCFPMAEDYLERAIKLKNVSAEAMVHLAELYERRHQNEKAADLISLALESFPDSPSVLLAKGRMDILSGQFDKAEKRLRDIAQRNSADTWTRARAWYELGAGLDRSSRFDEAMSVFLEAKTLLHPGAGNATAILAGIQAHIKELEATVTAEVIERWQKTLVELEPRGKLAILCGHPRSGTTLLEQILDSHRNIISAEETHIMHDEAYLPLTRGISPEQSLVSVLDSCTASKLNESRRKYFECTELFLQTRLNDRLLLDKNPALNVLIPPVLRIFPEAKFLVAMRDPRDVCLSCFMQPLTINPVSSAYLSLEGTARQYASVVGFWRTLMPRMPGRYIEVRYEDLVTDLEGVSRRVLKFLDIPWEPEVLRYDEHAKAKLIRSPTYRDVTKPVFRSAIGRWKNYEKHLSPYLDILAPFME